MKLFLTFLMLAALVAAPHAVPLRAGPLRVAGTPVQAETLAGRWRVKFALAGIGEKNLIFESQARGSGSVLLLDTGPDNKAEADPRPAAYSQLANGRVGFSAEVELPIGTCCRETGTLMFKGKFDSTKSISGRAIFVGTTVDEENFTGFRSTLGTFKATRE